MKHCGLFAAGVIAVGALGACGADNATSTNSDASANISSTAANNETDTEGNSGIEALDAETICKRLAVASVAADTGLDIVLATPDGAATPQCAYEYTNDTGGVSNLTVASMRSEDVGGSSGRDAFDFVVQINTALAGDDVEIQEVSAGDAGIRLSGSSLHLGVVQVGNRVLTVIIPIDDAGADAVDRLIGTMATALG